MSRSEIEVAIDQVRVGDEVRLELDANTHRTGIVESARGALFADGLELRVLNREPGFKIFLLRRAAEVTLDSLVANRPVRPDNPRPNSLYSTALAYAKAFRGEQWNDAKPLPDNLREVFESVERDRVKLLDLAARLCVRATTSSNAIDNLALYIDRIVDENERLKASPDAEQGRKTLAVATEAEAVARELRGGYYDETMTPAENIHAYSARLAAEVTEVRGKAKKSDDALDDINETLRHFGYKADEYGVGERVVHVCEDATNARDTVRTVTEALKAAGYSVPGSGAKLIDALARLLGDLDNMRQTTNVYAGDIQQAHAALTTVMPTTRSEGLARRTQLAVELISAKRAEEVAAKQALREALSVTAGGVPGFSLRDLAQSAGVRLIDEQKSAEHLGILIDQVRKVLGEQYEEISDDATPGAVAAELERRSAPVTPSASRVHTPPQAVPSTISGHTVLGPKEAQTLFTKLFWGREITNDAGDMGEQLAGALETDGHAVVKLNETREQRSQRLGEDFGQALVSKLAGIFAIDLNGGKK